MSDLQSLTSRIEHLSRSVDVWNNAMVWATIFAAVSAVFIFITTRLVVIKARQLSVAQEELNKEKDRQLARDLKSKDERIAELQQGDTQLHTDLENATAASRAKETELSRQQGATAKAQKEAADAQLALQKHIEGVARRQKPRKINGKVLRKYLVGKPKKRVELRYSSNDSEAYWFADQIYLWLGNGNGDQPGAGWDVAPPKPLPPEAGYQGQNLSNAPTAMRFAGAGSMSGLTYVVKENWAMNSEQRKPLDALVWAVTAAMSKNSWA